MRIKRENDHGQRVPIIGNIRIGEKDERGIPHSLDYFRADGDYAPMFNEAFGEKPSLIEIAFMSDEEDRSVTERLEIRQGKKLFAFGDGFTFNVWNGSIYEQFTKEQHPDIMERVAKKCGEDAEWKEILTMYFIIPRIRRVFGLWRLTTSAEKSSIPNIVSVYDWVMQLAGRVRGIPFDLKIEKVKSNKPESKSVFPVLSLIPNVSQGNMEKLRTYITDGNAFMLLTEDKINSMIEYKGE